jgi:ubiquinone/menaquinone biosynthesis C-methylase UbiE
MSIQQLYDKIAERKLSTKDYKSEYIGDNGRINKCLSLFKNGSIKTGGALLDVGGGCGDLCIAAKDLFCETTLIDVSLKSIDAAKERGLNAVSGNIDEVGLSYFKDNTVDIVTALDFIEHIIDPQKFANECFRILKDDGQCFINTPNIQFFMHIEKLLDMNARFPRTSGDKEVWGGGHLAYFTYCDLEDIFRAAGFRAFKQFTDTEGYRQPIIYRKNDAVSNHKLYCERFGNPNLLFLASK